MSEQKKFVRFTSPKGVAKYPHLIKPQATIKVDGQVKPVKPSYLTDVLYQPDDAAFIEFKAKIEAAHAAGYAAAKKENPKKKLTDMGLGNIFRDETDKEGTPTGNVQVKFKKGAEGKKKDGTTWTANPPALIDGKGKPMAAGTMVYGGSVVKISYSIKHTAMPTGSFYTSLTLEAVQILVLKSQPDRDGSFYGFQNEEGDDSSDENTESTPANEGASEAPASGADF